MSAADDMYAHLLGTRPAKAGVAYERFAALMFAILGWEDVRHNVRERPAGRRAKHQLDVTARHPNGEVSRLIVECKDWDKTVGKGTLDALVGVRNQLDADAAAAVTTEGFTKGARDVAVDENVALIRMRPYDEADKVKFVQTIELQLDYYVPTRSNWSFEVDAAPGLPSGTTIQIAVHGETVLKHVDGKPAETFAELVDANGGPMKLGTFDCRADLGAGRLVPTGDGREITILALTWTEEMHCAQQIIRTGLEGEPCLVMEQLDEHGESFSGRVFVDRDLHAWSIDEHGKVTEADLGLSGP
jgi:hypothetical protein